MPRVLPYADDERDLPINETPTRVWRVTKRDVTEHTTLRMADTAEKAVDDQQSSVVAQVARTYRHEVVECVEYVPHGTIYRTLPEDS